jgi:hypothetical protein
MPRRVIVKPLEQIDVTRMILNARKHLYEKERAINQTSFGLGYYHLIALLEPRTGEGILCHKCRSFIWLGESFAKKSSRGKPYHIECAKRLNLI